MSPELLIRRLVYSKEIYNKIKKNNRSNDFYAEMILKNFDNPNQILNTLNKKKIQLIDMSYYSIYLRY